MVKTDEKLIVDGKRLDGRGLDEMRTVKIDVNAIDRADGSAQMSFGNTEAIVSVFGPRKLYPRFLQESDTGILRCRYSMAPFSVDERKRPGPTRRSIEISKVARLALEPATFLDDFPKTVVDVFIEIIRADGSTRVTGINAASIALATAGVPMKDLVTACSVGKIDNQLIVDLNGIEDNNSDSDLALAMMPSKNQVTLLQMDGRVTREELFTLLDKAANACSKIYEMQKSAIKEAYKR